MCVGSIYDSIVFYLLNCFSTNQLIYNPSANSEIITILSLRVMTWCILNMFLCYICFYISINYNNSFLSLNEFSTYLTKTYCCNSISKALNSLKSWPACSKLTMNIRLLIRWPTSVSVVWLYIIHLLIHTLQACICILHLIDVLQQTNIDIKYDKNNLIELK